MTDEAAPPRIVVLARWPEPGKVKTRLARAIGDEEAARVYCRLLEHTVDAVKASGLPWELRVTGATAERFEAAFGNGITVTQQGEGDLGERLARIAPPALVIGSDLPGLTSALLRNAAAMLAAHGVVIGPARDGGYWLIGIRHACPWLFADMPWSTPTVLAQTLARLDARGIDAGILPELADIDQAEDLAEWPGFAS